MHLDESIPMEYVPIHLTREQLRLINELVKGDLINTRAEAIRMGVNLLLKDFAWFFQLKREEKCQ